MGKTFELYGKKVEFTEGQVNYNEILMMLRKQGEEVENEFEEQYYSSFSDMDEVMSGIDVFICRYIDNAIKIIIQYLAEKNVYTYDVKRFRDLAGDYGVYERIFKTMAEVEDMYLEILEEQNEAAEYRSARKASRSRWEGGGFGVEGAIKGAALAGTANVASGLAHSTVNALGNMASAVSASIQKSKMYKNSGIVESYIEGLQRTYDSFSIVVADIINKETDIKAEYPREMSEASALIKNMQEGYIKDKEQILEKCIGIIKVNPYFSSVYSILIKQFEDPNGELEEIANYFGSTNIKEYKEREIIKMLSHINYSSIEDISVSKTEFIQWANRYNVQTECYVACLEEVIKELDIEERTIDGELYDTVDSAEENEERINELVDKVAETNGNEIEKIENVIKEFEESNILSKEKYIAQLKKELQEEDIRFRTVKKSVYSTREEASVARKEAKQIDECLKKICSFDEVNEIKDKVTSMNTDNLKKLYMEYLGECESVYGELDEEHIKNYQDRILHSTTRKELAKCFYEVQKWKFIGNALNLSDERYDEMYSDFRNAYLNVNGKTLNSPIEADKAYLKYVEHGKQYLKYITEKNEKKTFFASLKNNVTGLVYKNYEGEYNALTENGTKELPLDMMDDLKEIEMIEANESQKYKEFKNRISQKYEKVRASNEIKDKELDVSELVYPTKQITEAEVEAIMKKCCPEVEVKIDIDIDDETFC